MSDIVALVAEKFRSWLEACRIAPHDLGEHAGIEELRRTPWPVDASPRQLERQDDLAASLVEALWDRIVAAVIIPDAHGTRRPSVELQRLPLDDADSHGQWRELAPLEARACGGGVTRVAG